MSTAEAPLDALIVGGGPAGVTIALTMARQLHTAVVFDSQSYRNALTPHMHTVPTWDHKEPALFRSAARDNILQTYSTIQCADVEVTAIARLNEDGTLFEAADKEGKKWYGKKVALATGVVDVLPDIPGYDECWVKGMSFHCLFCHGYESRHSASSGILAVGDLAAPMPSLHFARNAFRLTPSRVTLYTNGAEELAQQLNAALVEAPARASSIGVDSRRIARLEKAEKDAEVIIHFEDGTTATEGFLAHKPKCLLKGPFAQQLKLELAPTGDIKINPPFYQTSMRGVFAAGDDAGPIKIVNHALFTGSAVAAGLTAQLQAEELGHKGVV